MLKLEYKYLLGKGNRYAIYDDVRPFKIIKDFKSKTPAKAYFSFKKLCMKANKLLGA